SERFAADLVNLAVLLRQPVAVNPHRRVVHRAAHQGDNAGGAGAGAEDAIWMKAQRFGDRRRRLADVDLARLSQITFADAAGERLRRVPDAEHEFELLRGALFELHRCRAGPVLQRGNGLGLGHAFDPREPTETVAMRAAAEAMIMV